MNLLVDIGNTRIKWATAMGHELGEQQASSYAAWDRSVLTAKLLSSSERPERILVANVGGDAFARLLTECALAKWSLLPEYVRSSAAAAGVRNAYPQPEQLGVDRWLGVIAAYQLLRAPACVVSVGTALTVDGVDDSGKHVGGVIVPGPDLAISTLLANTSDLAARSQSGKVNSALFADNTLGAIHQGIVHMLAALVEKSIEEMRETLGATPALLLTGGGAERIAPLVQTAHRIIPDLVLRGLAVLARS